MSALRALLLVTCSLVLGVGCSGGRDSSGSSSRPGGTIRGCGLEVRLPPGWDGYVTQLSPRDAITLRAATVGLPPPGGEEAHIAAEMHAGDAYLAIADIGPPPEGLASDAAWKLNPALPLSITRSDVQGPYEGGFPSGASLNAVLAHRALMMRIRFGSTPKASDIEQVNELLASLSVSRSLGVCSFNFE
jgi:hypothetical protein